MRVVKFAVLPIAMVALALGPTPCHADGPMLASLATVERPGTPWQRIGLPRQTKPWTSFSVVQVDGDPVLQLDADNSYGHLMQLLPEGAVKQPAQGGQVLSWRWRLLQPNPAADLQRKDGDDTPVKVCAMFDMPLAAVPFFERQLLRLARERSGEALPTATVCYVWDARLPPGTVLDNAYTRRVRMIVLQGPQAPLRTWQSQQRDLAADFLHLFGKESRTVPAVLAIAVGADADNTQGRSQAQVADLVLK
jgi:hypothetical protein